jgi:hypothetical protein
MTSHQSSVGQRPAGPDDTSRCVVCGAPVSGPSVGTNDPGLALHPSCLVERLPYDAATVLIAAAVLCVVPFIRVWSA